MSKKNKQAEGVCPECGESERFEVDYRSAELDGDGSERAPYLCGACGAEGFSVRELVWSGYE